MSSDESPSGPAASERRDAVREKAQQVKAQQSRSRRIRAGILATAAVAVVAIGAASVTWAVTSSASKPQRSPSSSQSDGFAVTSVTGVGITSDTTDEAGAEEPAAEATPTEAPTDAATPTVDIRVYVDYLSTGSRDFQVANVQQLSKWVSQDAATLTYYPVAMLTAKSNGTKYSQRAAVAAACVATYSPDTLFAFNNTLLTDQPAVDTDGYTNTELADIAQGSGVDNPKVVRECIEEQAYAAWVKTATERALQGLPDTDGLALTGTPTVLVNGTPYVGAPDDPQEFAQFVLTIASDAYYKSTPTPTPTPSS